MNSIFKAYDVRGKVGSELTPEVVEKIGRALADWLPNEGPIAVGRDMRPDSAELAKAVIEGILKQGRDVIDIGEVTSDMIYFAVGYLKIAGGAMITASHNPGADNGIKIYRDNVIAVGLDSGLADIRDAVKSNIFKNAPVNPGKVEKRSIINEWVEHALSFASSIKPFHIAIDNGNGMAGAILPYVIPRLPIKVEEMYFEPDGTFPNHEANPQIIENLKDLIDKVVNDNFDFGIAFDGDGDRAVFVDGEGRPVLGTDLITIVAKYYLKKYPQAKIVHDVRTSRATEELIRQWGGTPIRTKAGRVNIGPLIRKEGAPFGGETTGHLFFKENFDADSGLLAAIAVMGAVSESGKTLAELVDEYRKYKMIPEKNIEITSDKEMIFERLGKEFSDADQDRLDGLTVNLPTCWFNLRASNTEPVMRLNAEAGTTEELDELVSKVMDIVVG